MQNPFGIPLFCITYEGNGGACVQLALSALGPLLSLSLWPPGNQPPAPSSGSFKCTQLLTFCTSSRTTDGLFPHDYCIILPYEVLSRYSSRESVGLMCFTNKGVPEKTNQEKVGGLRLCDHGHFRLSRLLFCWPQSIKMLKADVKSLYAAQRV